MVHLVSSGFREKLARQLGAELRTLGRVTGGDINDAYRVTLADGRRYFVKANRAAPPRLFEREAEGLELLRRQNSGLVVPEVVLVDGEVLVLELLTPPRDGGGRDSERMAEALGRGLARLHRRPQERLGLDTSNYLGTLDQNNEPHADWVNFYRERRLIGQLELEGARRAFDTFARRRISRLLDRLDELLVNPLDIGEPLSLLHGDLWGGNWLPTDRGPALIDPAVYVGHREVDLAMMHLFGGFPERAYAAYAEDFPLAPGAEARRALYQLYPLLVHVNLFGAGYVDSVLRVVDRYV